MILKIFWLGLSLLLINEGLSLTIFPKRWRKMIKRLDEQTDSTLHRLGFIMGIIAIIIGAGFHRLFPDSFGPIWLSVTAMVLIEGILVSLYPALWRKKMPFITAQSDRTLRQMGIAMLISGLGLWLVVF